MTEQLEFWPTPERHTFANFPTSIQEHRADSQGDPNLWGCRDILIRALRLIDSGKLHADYMVIAYGSMRPDGVTAGYLNKSNNPHEIIGLMHEVIHLIVKEP